MVGLDGFNFASFAGFGLDWVCHSFQMFCVFLVLCCFSSVIILSSDCFAEWLEVIHFSFFLLQIYAVKLGFFQQTMIPGYSE